jgi:hypothetical protein
MLTLALDDIQHVPVRTEPDGARCVAVNLPRPGLYQLTLVFDGRGFDWESLYQVLDQYGNSGARTGPWDFRLSDAAPLVPAFWVALDGRRLGLWYAQRVSLPDIDARRFRGRMALHVEQPGRHTLTLTPFNESARLPWLSATLEADPEDRLDPLPTMTGNIDALPAARWASTSADLSAFWIEQRRRLAGSHAIYAAALESAFDWALGSAGANPEALAVLLAAHHLGGRAGAIERALETIAAFVAKPAWGREREDVYGHNGDIAGGSALRCLAWALHMFAPQLGDDQRKALLAKLEHQADAFLTQALLMRDYWGGSVLQDHGWQAQFDFGTAALHLWGLTPRAQRWVSYAVPRLKRAIDAAPPDGVIPASSYCSLHLYAHCPMYYRDALLARTGVDLLDEPPLRRLPAFVASVVHDRQRAMLIADQGDKVPLLGGQAMMAALAAKHGDADAAWVHQLLLQATHESFYHGGQLVGHHVGHLWGFFAFDGKPAPPRPASPRRRLVCYDDSGLVQYRDDDADVVVALRCGPWLGYHAHQRATGPCDRMDWSVGAGHFALFLNGQPMLCTPDAGYCIRSVLRSCLLVDDRGQIGDVGYPMSIPSLPHRGEEIDCTRWDAESGSGLVRLNLTRCYPADCGVVHYTRQFLLAPQRRIVVRDEVLLDRPRALSWLFQHKSTQGCVINGHRGVIGASPSLSIRPRVDDEGLPLRATVARTPVVWSYASASGGKPFDHLRYDTARPVATACVDFVLEW